MLDSISLPARSSGQMRKSFKGRVAFRRYDLIALILAIAYAAALASLPLLEFRDRENYLTIYAAGSDAILQGYAEQGIAALLSNEPVWLLINIALASILSPEGVVTAIIALPAFVVAWLTLRTKPESFIWLLVFLLYPAVIKNHIIHLRQGVAIAVFLLGFLAIKRPSLRWVLIGVTPFIHSSFFFVIWLMFLAYLSRGLRLAADLSMFLLVLATVAIILSLEWIASSLGARQVATYDLLSGSAVSGINFVFWLFMLSVMMMGGRDFLRRRRFEIGTIIFYLCTYFFTPVTARIFESTLLLVFLAGLELKGWKGRSFRFAVLAFGVVQWVSGYAIASLIP